MKDHVPNSPLNAARTERNGSLPIDRRNFLKNSMIAGGALLAGEKLAALEIAASPQIAGTVSPAEIAAARFPKDFLWGTATSSYQVEGAWNADAALIPRISYGAIQSEQIGDLNGDFF
jgi:hypothetical protein